MRVTKMDSLSPSSLGICKRLIKLFISVLKRSSSPARRGESGPVADIPVEFRHKNIGTGTTHQIKDWTNNKDQGVVLSDKDNPLGGKLDQKAAGEQKNREIRINGHGKGARIGGRDDEAREMSNETRRDRAGEAGLLRVSSNINEKSQAFIEWKRRSLSRSGSSDSCA